VSPLLVSAGVVALAEIGDKTQLLALLLAARLRAPVAIILGILAATIANHAVAGLAGVWLTRLVAPQVLRWLLGVSFLCMAVWTLIPDKLDRDLPGGVRRGAFGTAFIAFFLAEMGDKTQLATVALAARYDVLAAVVAGTTAGMMIANVPAVLLGNAAADRLPLRAVRVIAAGLFAALGALALAGLDIGI
jgi:Ca2+/H+ antiporter, TMEM165/GDT1 family